MGRDILVMSEGSLGIVNFGEVERLSWEVFRVPQLKKSYSILSGVCFKGSIILVGECSGIYSFSKASIKS